MPNSTEQIKQRLRDFADERDWDQFHSPKNLAMALIVNPLIVYAKTGRNPYGVVFTALRESGITAFFTRSSAASRTVVMPSA